MRAFLVHLKTMMSPTTNASSSSPSCSALSMLPKTSSSSKVVHLPPINKTPPSNLSIVNVDNSSAIATTSPPLSFRSVSGRGDAFRMQLELQRMSNRFEAEKQRLHSLDETLCNAQDVLEDKRHRYLEITENIRQLNIQLKTLENYLEHAVQKLDTSVDENNRLRETIDQLRKDRFVSRQISLRLEKELQHSSERLEELESVTHEKQAMEPEVVSKIEDLRRVQSQTRHRYKETYQTLHSKLKLRECSMKKINNNRRNLQKGQQQMTCTCIKELEEECGGLNKTWLTKNCLKNRFLNAAQRINIKKLRWKIEIFNRAKEQIMTSTGISDLGEILEIFKASEKVNYSLMTYINNINNEIETLEMCKRNLLKDLHQHQQQDEETQFRRTQALSDKEIRIRKNEGDSQENDAEMKRQQMYLQACHPHILGVHKKIISLLQSSKGECFREGVVKAVISTALPENEEETPILPVLHSIEVFMMHCKELLPDSNELTWISDNDLRPAQFINRLAERSHALHAQDVSHKVGAVATTTPQDKDFPVAIAKQQTYRTPGTNLVHQQHHSARLHRKQLVKPHDLPSSNLLGDSESDDEELGNRPLSFRELKARSYQTMNTRSHTNNQESFQLTDDDNVVVPLAVDAEWAINETDYLVENQDAHGKQVEDQKTYDESAESNVQDWQTSDASAESNVQDWQTSDASAESNVQDWQTSDASAESNVQDWQTSDASAESNVQDWQTSDESAESNVQDWQTSDESAES